MMPSWTEDEQVAMINAVLMLSTKLDKAERKVQHLLKENDRLRSGTK